MATVVDDAVVAVQGSIAELHARHRAGASLPTGGVLSDLDDPPQLLCPVTPSKIVCVGLNYVHHAREMGKEVPDEPLLFIKPPSALVGPGDDIVLPPQSTEVHHEAELAVIIGDELSDADEAAAAEAIFGYTCALDISARDIQRREKRYTRAKGFDTFAPLGPAIALAPEFDPADQTLTCLVDGQRRQHTGLDDFIFGIDEVLSFISHVMTLVPGDVILTGTPSGVGPIVDGQVVTVEIGEIGTLVNPVVRR